MRPSLKYLILFSFLLVGLLIPRFGMGQKGMDESKELQDSTKRILESEWDHLMYFPKSRTQVEENLFNRGLINDPVALIQGRVEGLMISKPGSNPNGDFVSRMRGIQSIGGSNEPLIVIDGLPGADLNSVDPADVANITVLKDIAASSFYGIRGGNGVILISTKTGQSGKPKIRYRGAVSFDFPVQNLAIMSAGEYRRLINSVDFGGNTQWINEITQPGVSQVHNLSLSGKGDLFSYYSSINYRNVEGIAKNTGFDYFNGRLNVSTKILRDRGKIEMSMAATNSNHQPGFNDVFQYAIASNPTLPIYYTGLPGTTNVGGYAERDIFGWVNPVSIVEQAVNDQKKSITTGTIRAEYDFEDLIKGLSSSIAVSSQSNGQISGSYFPSTLRYGQGNNDNGNARRSFDGGRMSMIDAMINFQRGSESFKYLFTGGYSYQKFMDEGFFADGGNFLTNAFLYNNLGAARDFNDGLGFVDSYASSHKLAAFYGFLSLNFGENFFIDAGFRHEGSSRLGRNNKWHSYPSLGIGGRLDRLMKIKGFDYLIGRISMGKAGRIPDESNLSIEFWEPTWPNTYYNGNFIDTYGVVNNENNDLGAEYTSEVDIGIDFSIGDRRLSGSFDWYQRNTKDMILSVEVPVPPNVSPQQLVNLGHLRNSGIEFSINWNVVNNGSIDYLSNLVIGTYNTTVIDLTKGREYSYGENGVLYAGYLSYLGRGSQTHRIKQGELLGDMWGPVWAGKIDTQSGYPELEDINRDGAYCFCDDDHTVIGNGLPKWSMGWSHNIELGKFELRIFFRGVFGHDLLNGSRVSLENLNQAVINNWNVVNTSYFNSNVRGSIRNNYHVEKGNYFSLDNITLVYNLPNIGSLGISEATVFLTGQNLLVFSNYTGMDPEVRYNFYQINRLPSALAPGLENMDTYLPSKTITLGLQISF